MNLQIVVYDKRIDCIPYNGFYYATFDVEYHEDIRTPDNPPSIIVDSITLHTVQFQHDREIQDGKWDQFIGDKIPMIMKAWILSENDFFLIKEKIIDKAGTLTTHHFRELI